MNMWLENLGKQGKKLIYSTLTQFQGCHASPDPSVKVNSTKSLTSSTLLHRLVLLSVCFIYPMSGRYSTIWNRKGWPGSDIQMFGNVLQLTGLKFVQLRHSLGPTLPAVTPGFNKCINIHRITNKWWDFIIKRRLYWIHIVFFLKFLWFPSAVNLFLSLS